MGVITMPRPTLQPKEGVVELFKEGLGNDAIAEKTGYSVRYVENLRYSLRKEGTIGPPLKKYCKSVLDQLNLEEGVVPVKFSGSEEASRAARIVRELRKEPLQVVELVSLLFNQIMKVPELETEVKRQENIIAALKNELKNEQDFRKKVEDKFMKLKYNNIQGTTYGD